MVRLLTLSGLFLLLAAVPANAGVREKILRECQGGRITGHYTPAQLRDARKHIPTDIDEYSDCRDVLARAALAGGSASGSRPGNSTSVAPGGISLAGTTGNLLKPEARDERSALRDARSSAGHLSINGNDVIPAAAGLAHGARRHELPTTLLAVLILLALCGMAASAPTFRRRVLARRKP